MCDDDAVLVAMRPYVIYIASKNLDKNDFAAFGGESSEGN